MNPELADLGLAPFFTQQLNEQELARGALARITEVQRSGVVAHDGRAERSYTLGGAWFNLPAEERPTVGDWVVLNDVHDKIERLLERKSVFKRVAVGSKIDVQLIAANIDTLFVVTSCNDDFNESRLERYLAIAAEAGVEPVLVLTKADLVEDADSYRDRVRAIGAHLPVEIVNSHDTESLQGVLAWVGKGMTVALVGSSGVGKSTIVNSLAGQAVLDTGAIREHDAKGRHTTSYRSLHRLPGGGLLLDVPGMRELKVAQLDDALSAVFADVATLADNCRFRDCEHNDEPGCAVRIAIEAGALDERRLRNYRKLLREEARHTTSLADQRHRDKKFARVVQQSVELKRKH
ncbi:MAG: ribosome small subunit-dependent GTPase A [Woeseia sp.]